MIRILLVSTLFWVAVLFIYHFTLRKLTFHHLNRYFLLSMLLVGVLLPFFPTPGHIEMPIIVYLDPVIIGINGATSELFSSNTSSGFNFWPLFIWLYTCIALLHLLKLIRNVYALWKATQNAHLTNQDGVQIVQTAHVQQPHSFFKWIFINKDEPIDPIIIQHEWAHIKGGHSWDKLLLQFIAAIYWIVPVFSFYRRYINEIHEYIADAYVLRSTSKKKYSYFLLACSTSGLQPTVNRHGQTGLGVHALSNHFHSLIKNRITMILQKKSKAHSRLWYLPTMIVLLGIATIILLSCDQEQPKKEASLTGESPSIEKVSWVDSVFVFDPVTEQETVHTIKNELEVYDKLDQMPLYSLDGCDGITDSKKKFKCANNNLMQFIGTTIKYPKNRDKEGLVVLKFIVDQAGNLQKPEIVETIGEHYSAEVMKMYHQLEDQQWIPGTLDGEAKAVYFNLPIKFKLE